VTASDEPPASRVAVRVPASSANIGPGFDALGVALTLDADVGIVDEAGLPPGAHVPDLRHPAVRAFVRGGGAGEVWVRSPIPSGRGLGFSGAMYVGGLLVAHLQRLGRMPVGDGELAAVLAAAAELEGHADNAAASLLGGIVAVAGGHAVHVTSPLDPAVVVWVPDGSTSTKASRARLGSTVPFDDAVFNIGRTALLVAALSCGDVAALRIATQDRIHQADRLATSPASAVALAAALDAGAWCAWLSGSGPSVAAMCDRAGAGTLAAQLPAGGRTITTAIEHRGAGPLAA
jgi:homoserine kinase